MRLRPNRGCAAYTAYMKNMTLAFAALSVFAAVASAEPTAMNEATMLANGIPARLVMDGTINDGSVVAQAAPAGTATREMPQMRSSAVLAPRAATPSPAAKPKDEPGFFSKAWDKIKTPAIFAPAIGALTFGALGFMVGGPLGALTGVAIGGLLGFIFAKAMGG